jgi:enolase-phosphatase E1
MNDQKLVELNHKNENSNDLKTNELKLKIRRPNKILIDIYGVITSWDFVKELKSFIKNNLKDHLTKNWKDRTIVHIVNKLREQSLIDKSAGIDIPVIEKEEPNKEVKVIIESVVANILWQIEKNHKSSEQQLNALYNQMWSEAYNSSHLKTHAFADVKISFNHWRCHKFIKIYSYASGPPEGQKQFLRSSVEGDLSAFVANCLNSSGGYKYDPNKYKGVICALRETDPKNLLYLTDDPKKARAAIESGMRAIVVLRPGNHKYTEEDLKDLDRITSFADLEFEDEQKLVEDSDYFWNIYANN